MSALHFCYIILCNVQNEREGEGVGNDIGPEKRVITHIIVLQYSMN